MDEKAEQSAELEDSGLDRLYLSTSSIIPEHMAHIVLHWCDELFWLGCCNPALVLVTLWCMVCALGGWPVKGVTEKTELIILLEQLQPPSEGVPPFEL